MITAQMTSNLHLLTKHLYLNGVRANWWLHTHTLAMFKRALDLCLTLPAMILLAPFLVLVALAVKLSDGGPALYWQTRVGQNGKPFSFPKFRSMRVHSDALLCARRLARCSKAGANSI